MRIQRGNHLIPEVSLTKMFNGLLKNNRVIQETWGIHKLQAKETNTISEAKKKIIISEMQNTRHMI